MDFSDWQQNILDKLLKPEPVFSEEQLKQEVQGLAKDQEPSKVGLFYLKLDSDSFDTLNKSFQELEQSLRSDQDLKDLEKVYTQIAQERFNEIFQKIKQADQNYRPAREAVLATTNLQAFAKEKRAFKRADKDIALLIIEATKTRVDLGRSCNAVGYSIGGTDFFLLSRPGTN